MEILGALDAVFDEEYLDIDRQIDAPARSRTSVYNVPGYRPVHSELAHTPVAVTGAIPADLEVYLRNSANVQFDEECAAARVQRRRHDPSGPDPGRLGDIRQRVRAHAALRGRARPAGRYTRSSPICRRAAWQG